MKLVEVVPNKSIGPFELGMTQSEVETIVTQLRQDQALPPVRAGSIPNLSFVDYQTSLNERYFLSFWEQIVFSISITKVAATTCNVMLLGVNLLQESVDTIIHKLKSYGSFACDYDDEKLANTYEFTSLGVALWREYVFHPSMAIEDWYKQLPSDEQKWWQQYRFFDRVSVENFQLSDQIFTVPRLQGTSSLPLQPSADR